MSTKKQRSEQMAALGRQRQKLLRERMGEKKYRAMMVKRGKRGGKKRWV